MLHIFPPITGSNPEGSPFIRNLNDLYQGYGFLTVFLTDPFSQLISRIMGYFPVTDIGKEGREQGVSYQGHDHVNAMGFYYKDAATNGDIMIKLFYRHDSSSVSWTLPKQTMDKFINSAFTEQIIFYPILQDKIELFLQLIGEVSDRPSSSETIQTLLLAAVQHKVRNTTLSHQVSDHSTRQTANQGQNGYFFINWLLSCLNRAGVREIGDFVLTLPTDRLINCTALKKPERLRQESQASQQEIEFIVENTRGEIAQLLAIFIDLFTYNKEFSKAVLSNKSFSLEALLAEEQRLTEQLNTSLGQRYLDYPMLTEAFERINQIRRGLSVAPLELRSHKHSFIMTVAHNRILPVYSSESGFGEGQILGNRNIIKEFGNMLATINQSIEQGETPVVDLLLLNRLWINIKDLKLPEDKTTLMNGPIAQSGSHNAVIQTSGTEVIPTGKILLPARGANLTNLNTEQLEEALEQLDVIKDYHFLELQGEIIKELATRQDR
jgi:hypothetical protein